MNLAKTLVLTCAALGLSVAAHAQDIVVNGSTTVLPVMQKAAESFMAANPDIKLVISGGGSGNGIKALGEKQCDVAMSSRDIKDKERAAAEKKGVKPVRIAVAVDAIVPVPPVTLVRALVALLDNAVAHSPAGGSIELSARRLASGVEIRVADHGAGISGIDPAEVFERFARTPDSGRGRGFGIGLSLVRDIAQRAGGSVVVESTSPGGTVFLLTLPTTTPR